MRRFVQEYKHELKVVDEDEDDPKQEGVEDIAKSLHFNLDEELLVGQGSMGMGGSGGFDEFNSKNNSMINYNNSILSFVNDVLRENSPNPGDALMTQNILSPVKAHHSTKTSLGSRHVR